LNNIISNAIKYSPKGGEINITATKKKEGIEVAVRDRGIGIPEEDKNRIFDRFYRARSAQVSTFAGLGLGLYISAVIIYQHKGKIWLESKEGKGSTFYFFLPGGE
jgi:signal transduction histidine kinase